MIPPLIVTGKQIQLMEILNDGQWHCSVEFIERMHIVDYRKRLSELKKQGYNLISVLCKETCGRKHKANVHKWKLEPKREWWLEAKYQRKSVINQSVLL